MKKILLTFTALSLSAAVSACGMHNDNAYNNQSMQPRDEAYNGDTEHKEHMQMMAQALFNAMDKNNDGVITMQEYRQYTRNWFKSADTDDNGKLTLEEVKAQLRKDKMKSDHQMERDGMNSEEREDNQDDDSQANR